MSEPAGGVSSHSAGHAPPSDDERIARHLRKRVLEKVSGDVDEQVVRDFPSDRFFAGALAPESQNQLDDPDDDLQSKMEPSALGVNVRVQNGSPGDELVLSISGSVWVRVNPTYDQMRDRESFVALGDREEDDDETDELLPVFERLELDIPPIRIPYETIADTPSDTPDVVRERAREQIGTAIGRIREQAIESEDIDLYLDPGDDDDEGVPAAALESESAFEGYLDTREGTPAVPEWRAGLSFSAMPDREADDGSLLLDIEFKNTAIQNREDAIYTVRDPTLFEVQIELETEGDLEFIPFTFDPLPEDFRYNRDLWGHGRNCTIVAPDEDAVTNPDRTPGRSAPPADPSAGRLVTEFIPQYRQRAYESADRSVNATFEALSDLENGGFEVLDDVADAMRTYLEDAYPDAREGYADRGWSDQDEADFESDKMAFDRELQRLRRGIRCLRQHPETVGRAFELMNETMDRMHEFDSWRLFQLVFIVIEIPDIASREHDGWDDVEWRDGETDDRVEQADSAIEVVDVLWFPTGGGKTEAFLGVSVWNMFFDRIRGKDFGVTAWTRFPLRLLSLQQLQRMSETIVHADIVRREQPDIGSQPSRSFSVGYLVGKANTPNALTGYNNDNFSRYQENEELREDAKVVPTCPACGSEVRIRITNDHRLAHVCQGNSFECDWQARETDPSEPYEEDELPIHVVDNELYRYAPTILAGTIDKITAIGYQRKMAHILTGQMDHECPIHGFASLGECTEKYGCELDGEEFEGENGMANTVDPYDPAPSVMVPDELHLLEESVGSFDGHYETGVDALQDLADAGRTKIIAPTATITEYEDQVHHLFMRGAERFPAPGPYLRENFYAQEQPDTQRYYIGLIPHGKTHINAIIDLLFYYHREIQELVQTAIESPDDLLTGAALEGTDTTEPLEADSIDEVLQTLTLYSTSLTYLLSKKDGDRLDQSIVSQLDAYMREEGRPPLASERMTGGTPFEEVQDLLDRLEDPWEAESSEEIYQRLVDRSLVSADTGDTVLELRDELEVSLDPDDDAVTSDDFRRSLREANSAAREGLGWLLTSWLNAITATSMISHGVDVDRFNMMVFFGMPRKTAEYIQSSSRAGRSHPGLVFNVCHPIRERDLSHYHFFEKYHEFLDRLVEPVPVNRWAKNSVDRTHPGLFMGLLLNHYMYQEGVDPLYFGDTAEEFIDQVDEDELANHIIEMYGNGEGHEEFMQDAEALTQSSIDEIRLDDNQWTSERLPRSAMQSLRDIDEQLDIEAGYSYKDIFERMDSR
ncbi:helicase-related protein [Salinarchaeum laminariae]|uniref:helicase-related protein n=1 Tax=Salinarchaeum laminariae TaxID=869888 RepID=UPI0020BDF795|nr:helicase-related protein [Salinarchaeum laminariae]